MRVKQVLRGAPGIEAREGADHLRTGKEIDRKESREKYAERIIKFLKKDRTVSRRKKEEENDVNKLNVEAEVFNSSGGKGEAAQDKGKEELTS